MSNPKRQHYIPKMLLKHFVDDKGILHFFDKNSPEKGVREQTPRTLFYERHLYTSTNLDGSRDYSTEAFFSKFEREADPVVCKIVDNARMEELPDLTRSEKDVWASFFAQLWRRLPALRESVIPDQVESRQQQQAYRNIKKIPDCEPIDFAEMGDFIRDEIWPKGIQLENGVVEENILPTLKSMSLWVAVISREQPEFVIGSFPIFKVRPDLDLDQRQVEIWMPLAHDVAVVIRHHRQEVLFNAPDEFTQKLNERVFDQSTLVAGRSREQIESLAAVTNNS